MRSDLKVIKNDFMKKIRGNNIKLSELSKKTGISLFKLRRHANKVLGQDAFAKQSSGYARYCNKYECLLVVLSCVLIEHFKSFKKVSQFV